jgi:hypothetical protein
VDGGNAAFRHERLGIAVGGGVTVMTVLMLFMGGGTAQPPSAPAAPLR